MSTGDKITWAYRSLILIGLVWLRLLEKYLPIWGALVVWAIVMFFILRRPGEGAEEQDQQQPQGSTGSEQ